ncbi:hypothetical protein KTO58_16890 [Chitinophaga pendula]|uniref:hypothetical protein n=1 Tax=Chitinophaga TaxID=79328 RepID=UPI000BAED154|nr:MULTISPECIES: hypothetical protein [Chitinophaga]ASZ11622.1 hypothetical protein CK934_11955 [Chitinophaga sp. MD30]UCJ05367.1 hypothetical protein KTO58_16890 [Chitinophaga pendula]
MQYLFKTVFVAAIISFVVACHSSNNQGAADKEQAAGPLVEAKPAGTIAITIEDKDKDTQHVKIRFQLGNLEKEKRFEVSLAKGVQEEDLYKMVWDKPNSCYIGVLKSSRSTRYYHASQSEDGKELKIFHVGTPPEQIWHYVEDVKGLGKITEQKELLQHDYNKHILSGKISADFIVRFKVNNSKDSVNLYTEFAGARKEQMIAIPTGYDPAIEALSEDHCVFGYVDKQQKVDRVLDIQVVQGRLKIKQLKQVY